MAQQNDPTQDPSIPSAAYESMAPKWSMIECLLGGTATMRAAGQDYLPKHSAESDLDYDTRLSQAILYNVTELTLESLVGRVFREELRLNDDVPQQIRDFGDDIDLQKNSVSTFCTLWFREAVAKGFAHCYIDMPAIDPATRDTRTLADDMQENRRPFWSLIKPENMIFSFYEPINGVQTLTHARLVEFKTTMVGFAEFTKTYIRVLTPGAWQLWENEAEGQKQRKPKWVVADEGTFDLPIIPLVTFYTAKQGNMLAKPPLEDLAYMNIRHWQSNSDQINVLTVARFPMLASSGAAVEAGKSSQPIGPRQLLTMRDPNGRFYYVEHSGKAITAGKEDLEGLEERMAAYGAEFLRQKVSGRTAFERAQDSNEAISPLKRMAVEFGQAAEQALKVTALWLKLDAAKAGTITINTQFTQQDESAAPLTALSDARKRMDISRRTWLLEMKRRGAIDQTIDVDKEIAQIKQEAKEGPLPVSYITATEQIRAVENVNSDSASDIVEGSDTTNTGVGAGSGGAPVKTTKVVKANASLSS